MEESLDEERTNQPGIPAVAGDLASPASTFDASLPSNDDGYQDSSVSNSAITTPHDSLSPQSKPHAESGEEISDDPNVAAFRAQVRRLRGHSDEEVGEGSSTNNNTSNNPDHTAVEVEEEDEGDIDDDAGTSSRIMAKNRRRAPRPPRLLASISQQSGGAITGNTTSLIPQRGTSTTWQATLNASNVMLGMGILSLPFAMYMAGWVGGFIMLTLFTLTVSRTAKLIAKCMDVRVPVYHRIRSHGSSSHPHSRSRSPDETTRLLPASHNHSNHGTLLPGETVHATLVSPATYADIGEVAFGSFGRHFITILFTLELMAAATALVVIAADSIVALVPSWNLKVLTVKIILTALFAVTTWSKDMSLLAYFSMVGVMALMSVFGVLVFDGLSTPVGPGSIWDPAETFWQPVSWTGLALSGGMFVVGLDGKYFL
jgi:hypothetical protein